MDQSRMQAVRPPPPPSAVKVWTNVAFESRHEDEDDLAPSPVSVPAFSKQLSSSAQQRASWAGVEQSNLRASLPTDMRRSQQQQPETSNSGGSWATPRSGSGSPARSQPGNRTFDAQQPHRLSQMGYAPSPSSRVSATGSELYPLTQLFGQASASGSPTGTGTSPVDDMVSNVSSIDEDEPTTAESRTPLSSSQDVIAWQAQVTRLLAPGTRDLALQLPGPPEGLARFYITRQKGGLLGLACTFRLFLEEGDVEVMSAVKSKQLAREGPTYTLYHAGETAGRRKEGSCIGIAQLAPNSTGTQYLLRGLSPPLKPKSAPEPSSELQLVMSFEEQSSRSELRSLHCLLPTDGGVLPASKDARKAQLAMLCTRQPDYDDVNGYTLPIDNRFFMTSVKNFQMVRWHLGSNSRGRHTLLQFGRLSADRFALDFAAPLCIKTAFATALAAMEAKFMNSSN